MKLLYDIVLDNVSFRGTAEMDAGKLQNGLESSQCEIPLQKEVSAVLCRQWDEAAHTAKCWLELRNQSQQPVRVSKLSIGFAVDKLQGTLHYFSSSWGKEFEPHSIPIPERFTIGTLTGRSSQEYSPWIGIAAGKQNYSLALAWSGNWNCELVNRATGFEVVAGLHEDGFFTDVAPGAAFAGTPVYLSDSEMDLDAASRGMRRYFIKRSSAVRGVAMETLPVTFNTWWCYEDRFINEQVCVQDARYAAEAGMTNFVLDAGWFGVPHKEINWFGKRGDWEVENRTDFPSGIAKLGQAVTDTGIPFGIWCEIEAVGAIAHLNETHPEMVARRDGESLGYLCMADERTRAWALTVVDRLVTEYHAKWIKFDFNVPPMLGCNEPHHGHGEGDGLYWHDKGYYAFLDTVREKYPDVVLENCGSGGMRNDLGILEHAHYAYMSDHDYIDNHFQCFWGAVSFIHPALCYQFTQSECISDHNGIFNPIPEDISLTKLDFYLRASLLSTCGFSYRFKHWKPEWLARLKHHVALFRYISKKYILQGELYRLTAQALRGGKGDRWQAYQYMAQDNTGYAFVYRLQGGEASRRIYLQGLVADCLYDITFEDCPYRISKMGHTLMREGLVFDNLPEEGAEILKIIPGR